MRHGATRLAMSYVPSMRALIATVMSGILLLTAAGGALGAKRPKRKRRPGCGVFCQNAGGLGGAPERRPPVTIPSQHLEMTSDGVVFLRATCHRRQGCNGAIILFANHGPELGRSDLVIRGRKTATVGVSLSARGIRYVRVHDDVPSIAVIALRNLGPVGSSARLVVSN